MNKKSALKQRVCQEINRFRSEIESIGDRIMNQPELGFREFKTAEFVATTMQAFGIPHETGLGITGVKGLLTGKKPGPTVAILGELDALHVAGHPMADPETGAAHGCGHNAQIAGLLGAMMGLVEAGAAEELSGRIVFFAVPAEECVEIEYRTQLLNQNKLSLIVGKAELIHLGHFDDIDMALIVHTHNESVGKKVATLESCNGFIIKTACFKGRASHAGCNPEKGINALSAAQLALAAINAQRETFRDEDTVRVHPILTKGGDSVNVVPADVRLETFVRGKTNASILDADAKVDRALRAGALAVGASVEIKTIPGCMPLNDNPSLKEIFQTNIIELLGEDQFVEIGHDAGSTDVGDISHLMPVLHPSMGGATGDFHSQNWRISDKELAYLDPAKALSLTVIDLLWKDAEKARSILANYVPAMTKEEYLAYQDNLFRTEHYDGQTGKSEVVSQNI
ncbi:amidohydrolase [Thermodesulfobacteriota bacterium]